MRTVLFIVIVVFHSLSVKAQVIVKMTEEGGVRTMPCTVNGLKLRFIFDTGASNVCISLSEALFMLKNGYLNEGDIVGSSYSQIANGDIVENTTVILREIEIGGISLKDVDAVIIHELTAPLLLGNSAIKKLGEIQINGDELIILNAESPVNKIDLSNENTEVHINDEDFIKYKLLADEGDAVAQYNLGFMYSTGEGITQDKRQAAYWYKKAAEQSDADAQYMLGLILLVKGLENYSVSDKEQAAFWIKKAYENGNDKASVVWDENELWKYTD
jgi:clan AA aspartic protease (TIGR02281 family)